MAKANSAEVAPSDEQIPLYHAQRVQLRPQLVPSSSHISVLNQGNEGVSVGFALAGMIDYLSRLRGDSSFRASPRMLYEMARRYDGTDGEGDVGTTLSAALYGWQKHGVTTESHWPYEAGKRDRELTQDRELAAAPFKPQSVERLPKDVEVMKAALLERGAVYTGATVHDNWFKPDKGLIHYSAKAKTIGGHAFFLVGYTPKGFIVQNSWGTEWGGPELDGQAYPGLAIWAYPDFEANLQDAFVVRLWPMTGTARRLTPVRAGYLADAPSGDKDFLNIMPDVRAISAVLAARDVKPPLALGLFGNWGTGKSFFMDRMKKEIRRLSELEKAKPGGTPYCQPIVQIEFNAWHFLDTNLWASLVSEIFDRLHSEIRPPGAPLEETRRRLVQELGEAEGLYRQSQLELKEAQQDLHMAEIQLGMAQIAQAVGAKKLASTSDELFEQVRQLLDFKVRLRSLGIMVFNKKGWAERWGILVLLLFGTALLGWLGAWLARTYPQTFSHFMQWVNAAWTWVMGALAWFAMQWREVGHFLRILEEKGKLADQLTDSQKKQVVGPLNQEQGGKGDVRATVQRAEGKVDTAKQRVEQVQRELDALSPRWQLQQYIVDRDTSQDYRSQLGLISLIRRDFEKLSKLLESSAEEDSAASGEAPIKLPFERIILYIDDLDRCTPQRVVDVLEAVHLLLAFPLFVVVVAVDPRWLRTCLESHYPELLSMQESRKDETLDQPATPQDYLEKIFQIPFYLRPIDRYGYSSMIRGLVDPDVDPGSRPAAALQGEPAEAGGKSLGRELSLPTGGAASSDLKTDETSPEAKAPSPPPEEKAEPVNPDLLKFKSWEMDDLQGLSTLFHTPRAVKRFINTYRLVKVGIDSDEIDQFEGSRSAPGTSRIAQVLLAVVAGYPNQAERFLQRLLAQAYAEKPAANWIDFLNSCQAQPGFEKAEPPAPVEPTRGGKKAPTPSPPQPVNPEEREWLQMVQALLSVSAGSFLPAGEISPYIEMVRHVARFSFSVSDLPVLRRK